LTRLVIRHAIGIDVGGTKIAAGLVERSTARIVKKEIIPTRPERGGEAVLRETLEMARRLHAHAAQLALPVCGIGVGICELVDLDGELRSDDRVKWRDLPARAALSEIAPTRFESDARAPAIAEARHGAGVPYRNFIYLTIGTGISYCLVLDGKPYAGAHGNAIIAASGLQSLDCENCGATLDRSLEDYAAGPALVARYIRRHASAGAQNAFTTGEQVTAAAAAGDTLAIDIVRSAAAACGNTAGFLINALDPQALIVAGGLGLAGGLYWDSFIASTRKRIWADSCRELPIVTAKLGADAGLIGAALCAPIAPAPSTRSTPAVGA
jgi:glucokinase